MAGRRERAVAGAVRTESAGRAICSAGARGRGWRRGGAGGGDGRARRAGRGAAAGAAAARGRSRRWRRARRDLQARGEVLERARARFGGRIGGVFCG